MLKSLKSLAQVQVIILDTILVKYFHSSSTLMDPCFCSCERLNGRLKNSAFFSVTHSHIDSISTHTQASDILITPSHLRTKRNTATRHRQDLVDIGQLPMMHCKLNVSSSSFLHQSQAISGLVWSAQSNKILCGPDRLVSSLLSVQPWAKCEFHMLVNCSLHHPDTSYWGQGRRARSALFTPHNIIMIEGGCAVLETETARRAAASCWAQAPVTPPDMWKCFQYHTVWRQALVAPHSNSWFGRRTICIQAGIEINQRLSCKVS